MKPDEKIVVLTDDSGCDSYQHPAVTVLVLRQSDAAAATRLQRLLSDYHEDQPDRSFPEHLVKLGVARPTQYEDVVEFDY